MNDQLAKPSVILRWPEHAGHWTRREYAGSYLPPDGDTPVECRCATEILFRVALHARPDLRGLDTRPEIVATAFAIPREVVFEGIAINDALDADEMREYDALYLIAPTVLGRINQRVLYVFLQRIGPRQLERVAAYYEQHGF